MGVRVRVVGSAAIDRCDPLGRRDRVVLAALVVAGSAAVNAERLAEALWGEDLPPTWRKAVHGSVARLRQMLGPRAVETTVDGYRLLVGDDEVDARRFEDLYEHAVELMAVGDAPQAISALREGLGLVQGAPFADLDGWQPGRDESARLSELARLAEERLVGALLADGRDEEAATIAASLANSEPLREQRWALLAEAYYRCDRQADALRSIDRARRLLREELGVDPGPTLVAIERAVLEHDPSLRRGPSRPRSTAHACPYKGLAPYDRDDADSFFGRDDDVEACVSRLLTTGVLAIVGPSGSGKSSLARAGIAPAIQRRGQPVAVLSPGTNPRQRLADVPRDAVLVVDQLEELFTTTADPAERLSFAEALVRRALSAPLVVTLRADFVAAVSAVPPLADLVQRGMYLLGPMTEEQLRSAIVGPATRAGLRLEPGLVDLLVRDVEGQAGALPLVSHALAETWERRRDRVLTVTGYRQGGGVQGAVAATADRVVDGLAPEARRITRSLFLRLVSLSDGGAPVSHRLARSDLVHDDRSAEVIDALLSARLLTADADSVEVAHEALGRAWPRLRTWLDEDRDGQRTLHHLVTTAAEWSRTGHDDAELYRGSRLHGVLEWIDATAPQLTALERSFLEASVARRGAEEHDLAAQAAAQRRVNRRLRRALLGVAVLLVLAVVAGSVAVVQQRRASSEEREAALQALVSNSVALRGTRRDLAALLAIEAHRLQPSAATESALFGTFTSSPGLERTVRGEWAGGADVIVVDAETIAVVDQTATVRLLDAATGVERDRLELPGGDVAGDQPFSAATPDGRYLALTWRRAFDAPTVLLVWDLEAREPRFPSVELPFVAGSVALSPDGALVAVAGGSEARSAVYDAGTGTVVAEPEPIPRPPDALFGFTTAGVAFTQDGQLIVTSQAGPIRFLDPRTGVELRRISGPRETAEYIVRIGADGQSLLTVGARGVMRYDLATGASLWPQPALGEACGVIAEVQRLGIVLCDPTTGRTLAFDLATGVELGPRFDTHHGINCALVVADGTRLVAAPCPGPDLLVWRLDGGGAVSRLLVEESETHDVVGYLPGGDRLLADLPAGAPGGLAPSVIDAGNGSTRQLPDLANARPTDDPDRVAASSADGTVGLFDVAGGERTTSGVEIGFEVSGGLAFIGHDIVWGVTDSRNAELRSHLRGVDFGTGTAVDPDVTLPGVVIAGAATTDQDHLVVVECGPPTCVAQRRDPRTGATIGPPRPGIAMVAGGGGVLVAATTGGAVVRLDPESLDTIGDPFPGITGEADRLELSEDGRRLLVLGANETVKLYDVATRTQLGDEIVVGVRNRGAALRPDGLEAAVGTEQGIVIWDLDSDHWVDAACRVAARNLTQAEWDQYIGDLASYQETCPGSVR